jgi:prepilin-type N-terminal cleavage/methylation domain-containing protein
MKKNGFTLIELLVALTIMIILSAIAVSMYGRNRSLAQDRKRQGDIDAVAGALESHFNAYADQFCIARVRSYCAVKQSWLSLKTFPTDPSTKRNYCVAVSNGGVPADPANTGWTETDCPSGYVPLTTSTPTSGSFYWKLCTLLDSNKVYCVASLQ